MPSALIPIVGMLIPIILVPVVLGIRHARYRREMEHAERMRALELGRRLPQDEPWLTPVTVSVLIGAGVPVGAFFAAWVASQTGGQGETPWMAAMSVGVTAVICGTVLAFKFLGQQAGQAPDYAEAKPPLDADAFDVVGSRG